MRIRRMYFFDGFHQDDASATFHYWTVRAGTVVQNSDMADFNRAGAGGTDELRTTNTVDMDYTTKASGVRKEERQIWFDWKVTATLGGGTPLIKFYYWADNTAGAHFGNGYMLEIDGTNFTLYEITTNTPTQIAQDAHGIADWTDGVLRRVRIYVDHNGLHKTYTMDSDGDNETEVNSISDTTNAEGTRLGIIVDDLDGRIDNVCVTDRDFPYILGLTARKYINLPVNTFSLTTPLEQGGELLEFDEDNLVEIVIEDGDGKWWREFHGRINKIGTTGKNPPHTVIEGHGFAWDILQSTVDDAWVGQAYEKMMDDIIDDYGIRLYKKNVPADGGTYTRTIDGKKGWYCLYDIAMEMGNFTLCETSTEELLIIDPSAWPSSGLTIDYQNGDIHDWDRKKDTKHLVNKIRAFRESGGAVVTDDNTSETAYGSRSIAYSDDNIESDAEAANWGNAILNAYDVPRKVFTIKAIGAFHALNPGEEVSFRCDPGKVTALTTYMCTAKVSSLGKPFEFELQEIIAGSNTPGMIFGGSKKTRRIQDQYIIDRMRGSLISTSTRA